MSAIARSVFAWLHRNWAFRLMEPIAFPLLLLMHSSRLAPEAAPTWAVVGFMALGVTWLFAAFVLKHWGQSRPRRRDWSRPILHQVQEDMREDVPLEERLGLREIPQPSPPPPVERFIRLVGFPLPRILDGLVTAFIYVSILVLLANGLADPEASLPDLLRSYGLPPIELGRWELAKWAAAVMLIASLRSWCANRRAELDGERTPPRAETAYG